MCSKLRYIGTVGVSAFTNFGSGDTAAFYMCSKLEYVYLRGLAASITFESSPLLHKKSLLYIIKNANPKKVITITLHHDAYARLIADQEILDALTAKNTELTGTGGKISLVCAEHSDEVTPTAE